MIKYSCQQCNHSEERSIRNWSCECPICFTMMSAEPPKDDYNLCDYCGEVLPSNKHKCACGNHYLIHWEAEEPLVNATIVKEILHCKATNTTTPFTCRSCGRIHAIYRTTKVNAFCSCGSLMDQDVVDLRKFRLSKRYSQQLMANILEISLRNYTDIESGRRTPSVKTLCKIGNICRY